MKISISTRQLFMLGFALLLITNIVVLAGVLYNRSGDADASITLTERELGAPYYTSRENSGFSLRIIWRVPPDQSSDHYLYNSRPMLFSDYGREVAWLDRDKLETLGFDTDDIMRNGNDRAHRKVIIPRTAYVVLEYDGATYQQALKQAQADLSKEQAALAAKPQDEALQKRLEKAERWLTFERIEWSRLFAVDVGLDPTTLRQKYRDRSQYIIAKGLITASYSGSSKAPRVIGRISRLDIDSIHVPLQFRRLFETILTPRTLRSDSPPNPPRFTVNMDYGHRLEPWIKTVRKLR